MNLWKDLVSLEFNVDAFEIAAVWMFFFFIIICVQQED